jgi:hypothetical protein
MDTEHGLLSDELVRAVELLSDAFARRSIRRALIDGLATSIGLIHEQWSPFASSEPERTAWLDAAVAKWVVRRE